LIITGLLCLYPQVAGLGPVMLVLHMALAIIGLLFICAHLYLCMARKEEQTTLLDLTLPALDLSEFNVAGAPGYSKQFFMFGPRDL
ncbi:hypothetical protein MJM83_31600, partial [Salmonella enterica subsp. enterica serovar Montevideo]|nr:hypothetical protein [Salmonella enterica subsp. enterica serovar Montevideo]